MKKLFTFVIAMVAVFGTQSASAEVFNHLGLSVGVGTPGIGFELSTPVTEWLQLRGGVDFMPGIKFHTDVDADISTAYGKESQEINLEGSLARTQGHLLVNFYPLRHKIGLFVAAGAYFGGADLLKIKGQADLSKLTPGTQSYVDIADFQLPIEPDGSVRGAMRTTGFRPYLGIGWGRPCPSKRVSFMVDLGVQFMGKLKVVDSNNKKVPLNDLEDSDDTFQKIINKLTVYPVLKFTINGRLF